MDRLNGLFPSRNVVSFDAVSLPLLLALRLVFCCKGIWYFDSTAIWCCIPSVVISRHFKSVALASSRAMCVSTCFRLFLAQSPCTRMTRPDMAQSHKDATLLRCRVASVWFLFSFLSLSLVSCARLPVWVPNSKYLLTNINISISVPKIN